MRELYNVDDSSSSSSSDDSVDALGCDCAQCPHDEPIGVRSINFNGSNGLIKGCHFCGTESKLSRCAECKVVFYCGQEHQTIDRAAHKTSCNKIKEERGYLEAEEISLRQHAGDNDTPRDAFEKDGEAYGHFWSFRGMTPYMRARNSLIEAILAVNTIQAVEEALSHCLEMLDLNHNDNQGIRGYIPPLYIRLERDQDCYDFIKWWLINWDDRYEWSDPSGVVKNQNMTEHRLDLSKGSGPLSHLVSLTLLYIRNYLFWCPGLHAAGVNAVHRKETKESERRAREIAVDAYTAVHRANEHFWSVLLNPMDLLTMRPDKYEMASFQQVPHTLQLCYNSWAETPGAFDVVREMKEWKGVRQALKAKAQEGVSYLTT